MSSNDDGQLIHDGQINAMASHVADHFALATINYDLKNSGPEEGWTPAVTTEDLTKALKKVLKRRRSKFVPPRPTLINEDGDAESTDVLRVADVNEKLNVVLVKLAESIALQQAAGAAMEAAVGLCVVLGIREQN